MKTHKLSKTRLYKRWKGIKYRCYGTGCSKYYMYGAKGIKMCEEWKNDFMAFYEWSMENGYRDDLTIDRIDYDGDYCPENCRWVDIYVQANNKSDVRLYNYKGEMVSLPNICRDMGIMNNYATIYARINKMGWDLETALNTPIAYGSKKLIEQNSKKVYEYNGEMFSKYDICEKFEIKMKMLTKKLRLGWTVKEIIEVPMGHSLKRWRKKQCVK